QREESASRIPVLTLESILSLPFAVQINKQLQTPTQQRQSVPFQSLLFHKTVTLVKSNSRSIGWTSLHVLK
ncbi:MAG: hypothetical protein ACON34_12835, partial [Flavobacteriales bacterium]